jgi:hypothetical protein
MKSRILRWAGHVARMGEKRNACGVLVLKSECRRPMHRSENNIKMYLKGK